MKRVLLPMLLVLAFAIPAHGETYASNLNIVLTNQTPYPVEPGTNVDVGIQLQNNGRDNARDVFLELSTENPFDLLPGQESLKFFSEVPALGSVKVSYKLRVNSSAVTGTYYLKFKIYFSGQAGSFIQKTTSINVQGIPDLVIDDMSTDPSSIEPGSTAKIGVVFRNVGTGSARGLQVQFNSSLDEIKPILSKGSVFLGDVEPGQTRSVVFDTDISSSAEEKTYVVYLVAGYKNENGNAASEVFSAGIPVRGSVMLDVVKAEPLYDRNALRVEIANKGTASAKSIEASLVVGNETIDVDYVSELKPTKKTTMDFSPLLRGGMARLVINYVGPGLEKNTETKDISLEFGSEAGDGTGISIAAVIVIAVVTYYLWSRRRKARQHRQHH